MWSNEEKLWELPDYQLNTFDFTFNDEEIIAANTWKLFVISSDSGKILKSVEHTFKDGLISLRTLPFGNWFIFLLPICRILTLPCPGSRCFFFLIIINKE